MKKRLSLVALPAVAVLLLSACGGGSGTSTNNAGGNKALTWLTLSDWEPYLTPILEQYKNETGVTVTPEYVSFADLFEVIEVKIASGSEDYDVLSVDAPMVAAYASRDYLLPMDAYFPAEKQEQFVPSAVAAGSSNGAFWAPPMNNSSQLLFYNQDLLDQAGVEVPESSVDNRLTWEQVEDLAAETVDKVDPEHNQGIYGLMYQQISRVNQMAALPEARGGLAIGDDGWTVDGVINSEPWVDAMTWYQGLVNDGLIPKGVTADQSSDFFNAGKFVFMVGGTWTAARASDINVGFAPMPAFEGFEDSVATPTGSWHFGINKASTNPDEAAKFIEWMTLGEGNPLWLAGNNDLPSTVAAINGLLDDPDADPIMKIAAYEATSTAVPRALTPGFTEYSTVLDATFEDIRNGADVETALNDAVEQLDAAFAKYDRP